MNQRLAFVFLATQMLSLLLEYKHSFSRFVPISLLEQYTEPLRRGSMACGDFRVYAKSVLTTRLLPIVNVLKDDIGQLDIHCVNIVGPLPGLLDHSNQPLQARDHGFLSCRCDHA